MKNAESTQETLVECEEQAFARERTKPGMLALFELVYDSPDLHARQYIRMLERHHHLSGRVTIGAELVDATTLLATRDTEESAMRALLAAVAEYCEPGLGNPRQLSPAGLRMLGEREGLRLEAYSDIAGVLTIGFGHALTRSELSSGKLDLDNRPKWGDGITRDQADALLEDDADTAERAVEATVRVPLSQCQFDALVSFVYNVGAGAFRGSTLLRVLNDGQYDEVPAQLARWVYAAGRRRHGLIRRRQSEAEQWRGKLRDV